LKGIIADDSRFGQYAGGEYLPIDKAPILIEDDIQTLEVNWSQLVANR
jgi:hypothetical protein